MLKINDKKLLDLIKAAQSGDMQAFGDLYTYSYSRVYQTALIILRNKEDAEDACQEVFIRVLENISSLRIPEQYNFWLHRITVNQCLNLKRKRVPESDDLYDAEYLPDLSIDVDPYIKNLSNERQGVLLKSLLSMSEVQRVTIILKYYHDLKVEEIASILHCSPGTVKSRLNKGRNLLKKSLLSNGMDAGFLGALPIGAALDSWAQASLPSVETTTHIFHQVTASGKNAANVSLKPIEAAKAGSRFMLTGSGVFAATAITVAAVGGTALAITTLNTGAASAPVQPSAEEVFAAPSISTVSYTQEYLPELPLTLKIEHPESVVSLQLISDKGEVVDLPFDGSGTAAFTLSENGHYQVIIQDKSGDIVTKNFDIQTIDHEAPTLIDYTSEENHLTVTLSDEGSGIDFDSIYANTDSNLRLSPVSVNPEAGQITFEMPNENSRVYFQDKAGNSDTLSIETKRETLENKQE